MSAPASDPTKNMQVKALLVDQATGKPITFDLTLSQQGRPFFVWGTGINPDGEGSTVQTRNYYFSLTRLAASGTIDIAGEKHAVSGVTWMDHEYGAFGTAANPVKWFLQDMQLDNGVCISNYATLGAGTGAEAQRAHGEPLHGAERRRRHLVRRLVRHADRRHVDEPVRRHVLPAVPRRDPVVQRVAAS